MLYLIGALVGLAFGSIVAFLKEKLLWGRFAQQTDTGGGVGGVLGRSGISFAVNLATLLIIFLLREKMPFSWEACIVAAATALAVLNMWFAARKKAS